MSDTFDRDETDNTMNPAVVPVYQQLLAKATAERLTHVIGYVRLNGRKVTCVLYLTWTEAGIDNEQFEYYTYHYWHRKIP